MPFSDGLSLRPFVLNGVEIGRVGRQELQYVAAPFNGVRDVLAFVEGGVVHDNGRWGIDRRQGLHRQPLVEHIGIGVALCEAHVDQALSDKRADGIGPALFVPVDKPGAAPPLGGVAVRPGHVRREATSKRETSYSVTNLTSSLVCGHSTFLGFRLYLSLTSLMYSASKFLSKQLSWGCTARSFSTNSFAVIFWCF
jgi:hypothetical protein